ncbi:hypothetical protein B0T20DRAFT_60730 [Sordaria brevicollis]|uniref:Uncharacterized protein n=1 Tax=Sordaria brevicollis TaxID=83679 RepID=A0AAE0P391_SORBR|nr:hypothetical protein B0T20DRAFT_60730 [Sordaria brevicollis]
MQYTCSCAASANVKRSQAPQEVAQDSFVLGTSPRSFSPLSATSTPTNTNNERLTANVQLTSVRFLLFSLRSMLTGTSIHRAQEHDSDKDISLLRSPTKEAFFQGTNRHHKPTCHCHDKTRCETLPLPAPGRHSIPGSSVPTPGEHQSLPGKQPQPRGLRHAHPCETLRLLSTPSVLVAFFARRIREPGILSDTSSNRRY